MLGGDAGVVVAPMPWDALCDGILAAYKAKQDIVVLQRFEELQVMPELDVLVGAKLYDADEEEYEVKNAINGSAKREGRADDCLVSSGQRDAAIATALEKVEFCWGRAVLSAKRIAGDDDEHIGWIVDSFEQRFELPSKYLRVLAITADSPLDVLRIHQLMEVYVSSRAVTAALHMFPSLSAEETRELLEFLRDNGVSLTRNVSEQLEKHYVLRMKTEDAEEVFQEMCAAGVKPMSTRPYSFVFMKTTPFKYMSLIEYYEDMLDRGITPENSTFRILSKHTQNEGFANQHFSTLAWGNSAPNRQRDDDERGGTQVFFAFRLMELARSKPDVTLDEALNVFHRMDVEGTQLTNGSPVISALLIHFCCQENLEDAERVLRIARDRGCYPTTAIMQRLFKTNYPLRFHHAELVLQHVVEKGEPLHLDCVELLRYFVHNNMRSRAVRIFRAYVIQNYRNPKEPIPFAIATTTIKLGPFDWALGVLALLLVSVDKPLGRGIQSRMRRIANDGRGRDVLAVLERCDWKRDRLLTAPELQEPGNNDSSDGTCGGCSGSAGSRSGSVNNGNAFWMEPTSSHQRQERGVTWMGAMHVALCELNVGQEIMDAYKAALLEAIGNAKRCRNCAT